MQWHWSVNNGVINKPNEMSELRSWNSLAGVTGTFHSRGRAIYDQSPWRLNVTIKLKLKRIWNPKKTLTPLRSVVFFVHFFDQGLMWQNKQTNKQDVTSLTDILIYFLGSVWKRFFSSTLLWQCKKKKKGKKNPDIRNRALAQKINLGS